MPAILSRASGAEAGARQSPHVTGVVTWRAPREISSGPPAPSSRLGAAARAPAETARRYALAAAPAFVAIAYGVLQIAGTHGWLTPRALGFPGVIPFFFRVGTAVPVAVVVSTALAFGNACPRRARRVARAATALAAILAAAVAVARVAGIAAVVALGTAVLAGALIYPAYRTALKPLLLAESPRIALAFERKEHLGIAALALAVTGWLAQRAERRDPGATHERSLARLAYALSLGMAALAAVLGSAVAATRTF
jgi:hypothetical protein